MYTWGEGMERGQDGTAVSYSWDALDGRVTMVGYFTHGVDTRPVIHSFAAPAPQPAVAMTIKTRCERTKPCVSGIRADGELEWECREMPRWEMEMFPVAVNFFGTFFTRWIEVAKYESSREEFGERDGIITEWLAASKQRLEEFKRMYPMKKKTQKRVYAGD